MAPPWAETQTKVVIEFLRGGGVGSRTISFKHRPDVMPTQLHGRVEPNVWFALMTDVMELAKTHPYTQKPTAGRCMGWLGGFCMSAAVGFCFINPDGGDYAVWLPQVNAVLDRHRLTFTQGGCNLSLQDVHGSMWIQIDVDARAMAVGKPVMPPTGAPAPYAPTPTGPGPYSPMPTGPYSPTPTGPYSPSPTPGPYHSPSPAPGYAPHPDPSYVPPPTTSSYPPANTYPTNTYAPPGQAPYSGQPAPGQQY